MEHKERNFEESFPIKHVENEIWKLGNIWEAGTHQALVCLVGGMFIIVLSVSV